MAAFIARGLWLSHEISIDKCLDAGGGLGLRGGKLQYAKKQMRTLGKAKSGRTGSRGIAAVEEIETEGRTRKSERVNDFATPGVMNLLCRVVDRGWGVSPVVAG